MTEHIHKSVIECPDPPGVETQTALPGASPPGIGGSFASRPAPAATPKTVDPVRDPDILVVDDEQTLAHVIRGILEEHRCRVRVAHSAEEGLALLAEAPPDVAVVDIVLPGINGIEMLGKIKAASPETEVLIMTSHASVETAVNAIRQGAYDYLQKPFEDVEDVWSTVRRAWEKRDLLIRNRTLLREAGERNRELSAAVMRLTSLTEAGRAMGYFQTLPELLDFVLGLVADELEVDRASLMLVENGGDHLKIAASRGITGVEVDRVRVPLGEGIAGRVARTGQPFLVTDIRQDPRIEKPLSSDLSDSFISAPIVLSLPIKSRETVLGVLNVTNRRSGEPFTEQDLSYLTGLAGQVAVAVERTGHFEALKKTYESLKAAQAQMVRSERLKAVGEMAAGVAHDFNNALSVVLGKAQVVLQKLQGRPIDLENIRIDLETIRKVSEQAAETVRRVQDYTRIRRDVSNAAVDFPAVVRDAVEITRPKWKAPLGHPPKQIDLLLELQDVPPVLGNAHELAQVVSNMIFNSVEAMPDGGTISIRVFPENEQVVLELSDTGEGMSPETQERLFEPFFTTKEKGQGLGASIIFGIVSRHQGQVDVRSEAGRGTTFRVRLPQAPTPAIAAMAAAVESPPRQKNERPGRLRILLVEDEDLVRETYAEALAASGHEVASFSGGGEALAALSSRKFDVVVTDLAMPRMSGLEVSKRVKALDPGLPVILLSGWAMQQDDAAAKEAGLDYILAKPCLIENLLETVRRAAGSKVKV